MLINISEMFCYAQTAILHPTAPLYSVEEKIVCYIYRSYTLLLPNISKNVIILIIDYNFS